MIRKKTLITVLAALLVAVCAAPAAMATGQYNDETICDDHGGMIALDVGEPFWFEGDLIQIAEITCADGTTHIYLVVHNGGYHPNAYFEDAFVFPEDPDPTVVNDDHWRMLGYESECEWIADGSP